MSLRKLAVMMMLAGAGIAVLALLVDLGAPRVSAQITPYTPPKTAAPGADWTERIEEILPPGVESRAEATKMIVEGFFEPVVSRIPLEGVRERLWGSIERKMRL